LVERGNPLNKTTTTKDYLIKQLSIHIFFGNSSVTPPPRERIKPPPTKHTSSGCAPSALHVPPYAYFIIEITIIKKGETGNSSATKGTLSPKSILIKIWSTVRAVPGMMSFSISRRRLQKKTSKSDFLSPPHSVYSVYPAERKEMRAIYGKLDLQFIPKYLKI
jgi:hypothetical protein